MYAMVLEALELKPGQLVLVLGSGSGYFAHLVAQLVGPVC